MCDLICGYQDSQKSTIFRKTFSHFKNHQNLWSDIPPKQGEFGSGIVCSDEFLSWCYWTGKVPKSQNITNFLLPISWLCSHRRRAHCSSLSEWMESPPGSYFHQGGCWDCGRPISRRWSFWSNMGSLQIRVYLTTSQDGHSLISYWLVDVTSRLIISIRPILWPSRRAFRGGGQLRKNMWSIQIFRYL